MVAVPDRFPPRSHRRVWRCGVAATGVCGLQCIATLYLGYCYGWWLRDNLLAQRLFQCNCPAGSEAVRYAPFILIASACVSPAVNVAPSGEQFILFERARARVSIRAADLRLVRDLPPTAQDLFLLSDTLAVSGRLVASRYVVRLDTPSYTPIPIREQSQWEPARIPRDLPVHVYVFVDTRGAYVIVPDDLARSIVFLDANRTDVQTWSAQSGVAFPITEIMTSFPAQVSAFAHPWEANVLGIRDIRSGAWLVVVDPRRLPGPWIDAAFAPKAWLAGDRLVLYHYYNPSFVIAGGSGAMWLPTANFFPVPADPGARRA